MFQFPVYALLAGSVLTYMWSADTWAYAVSVLAPVSQWFLVHPLPLIPVLFWILLLVVVVVLPLCSWFCVDPYPFTHHELHTHRHAYLRATKCHHHLHVIQHWPPTLSNQALLHLSHQLRDSDHLLEQLSHQHHLCHLPCGCHPALVPVPLPVRPSPPMPLPLDLPILASLLPPIFTFCLPCFGAYIRDGLPRSSPLEGGCGCCVAHTRLACNAQRKSGPQAKAMEMEEECYFCDSKTSTWTRVAVAVPKEFQPGWMWVVACAPCQAAFCCGYPPSSLYTWNKSNHRAKNKITNENDSVCTSCWLAKGGCKCKYPSIGKRHCPFIKHESNSARGGPRPDPPPKTETFNMAPIHDTALGSLQRDPHCHYIRFELCS